MTSLTQDACDEDDAVDCDECDSNGHMVERVGVLLHRHPLHRLVVHLRHFAEVHRFHVGGAEVSIQLSARVWHLMVNRTATAVCSIK